MVDRLAGGLGGRLAEDRLRHRQHRRRVLLGHRRGHVAQVVDPAALPGGAGEALRQRLAQPFMGIADHQQHPAQPAADQAAAELQPEGLGLAGAAHQAEHALLAAVPDADGDHRGLADDAAVLADLVVGGVEPDIGVRGIVERAVAEGGELVVELGADPADLAPAHVAATQRLHEGIDLAGADALDVGLLDDRQPGPVDPATRLQQSREEAADAQLGDLQLQPTDPGVEHLGPVTVPVGDALGGVLIRGRADHGGGLELDEALEGVFEDLPHLGDVGRPELVEEVLMRHPGVGHRGSPG